MAAWLHKGRISLCAAPGLKNLLSLQQCGTCWGAHPAFVTRVHQSSRQGQPFPGCPSPRPHWMGSEDFSSHPCHHCSISKAERMGVKGKRASVSLLCPMEQGCSTACARLCTCVKGRMHFLRIPQKMHPASSLLCSQPGSAEL